MKTIDVDVIQRTLYFYEWRCPHCMRPIEATNESDNRVLAFYCPKCGLLFTATGRESTERRSRNKRRTAPEGAQIERRRGPWGR